MLQQNPNVSQSPRPDVKEPELREGQEVRILKGQYRGTVGHVAKVEWDETAQEWRYIVESNRVHLGEYSLKELW